MVCDCGDGTMACACPMPTEEPAHGPENAPGAVGTNTCDCGDHVNFNCACTGMPPMPPMGTEEPTNGPENAPGAIGTNTCDCGDHVNFNCACTGMPPMPPPPMEGAGNTCPC